MTTQYHADIDLDVRGLSCPLPVIRTRKAVDELGSGKILNVITSDLTSTNEYHALANSLGLELLDSNINKDEGVLAIWLRKP
ncbi:MAG: sulfurtransferase TusA family protein [Gammaproteobacteria bacterium]|nr:sulfurtransferase TusA family protein [Gammaproteobacteria bacterium]